MPSKKGVDIVGILVVLAILNLIAYFVISQFIGGHSYLGQATAGKFYLGLGDELTAVPENLYRYSQIHGISTLALGVVAFVLNWISTRRDK